MSEDKIKHYLAGIGTGVCLLAYISGYVSGMLGWWWTFVVVFVIYKIIFSLIDA